jgi:diketogulonate reductase-like aldo/keto reductase
MSLPASKSFRPAVDAVDPATVPRRALVSGSSMPAIGLGTFGSDRYAGLDIAAAVMSAASVGYRHFDCASVYGNEHLIGHALKAIQRAGLNRDELWVTSKVWNDSHAPADVAASCRRSLKDLQLDYLDLYLVHWPFPNFHPPGCDVSSRSPDAKPYIHENYMRTWRAMEKLVEEDLVRNIGASNMTIPKLRLLLRDAKIKPAVNEMELHPHFQQPELFDFCVANAIHPVGYCPVGSPNRPERDRTPDDTVDMENPVIVRIAGRLGVHPAFVCIAWAVQRGQTPIPFSTSRANFLANLRAAGECPLTDDDMRAIAGIDKHNRLIKGQVFLWKENQTWEDLWDISGEITPP